MDRLARVASVAVAIAPSIGSSRTLVSATARSSSAPTAQELLDRVEDPFFISDFRQRQVRLLVEGFLQLAVELARAVWALDLPVAEEVALGQELVAQEADALAVVLAPVVAV